MTRLAAAPKTAMAAALDRAGINTTECRLRTLAQEVLRKCHGNETRAASAFRLAVGADADLWLQLLRLAKTAGIPGEGRVTVDDLDTDAQARNLNGDDGGQIGGGNLIKSAAASPTSRDGAGQSEPATQPGHARAAREPSAASLTAAAAVAKTIAITILDTYRVRDGRAIGDVRIGELERLRTANACEASVIRQIQKHAQASDAMRVRDVVKVEDMQRFIQRAAEIADAS